MRFNRFLHLIAFPGKAHRGSPVSGLVITKMPEADAPSQVTFQSQISSRYIPLSGGGGLTGVGNAFLRWHMVGNLQVGLGLRPGFRQQPDTAPQAALEQQPPEPVDAVADHADGARRTGPRVTMIGSQRLGRRPQITWINPAVLGVFPPGCRRPGPAGWPPTIPASGGRHELGRCGGSCPTSSPSS